MKWTIRVIAMALLLPVVSGLSAQQRGNDNLLFSVDPKPYARYWWFASMIKEEDVRYNINWLKAHGFGGVELAWVYPLNRFNPDDTSYTPRQEWLREWESRTD